MIGKFKNTSILNTWQGQFESKKERLFLKELGLQKFVEVWQNPCFVLTLKKTPSPSLFCHSHTLSLSNRANLIKQ